MNFVTTALAILQMALGLVPSVLNVIVAFESPNGADTSGKGPDQKAAVIALVEASVDLLPPDIKAKIAGNNITVFAGKMIDILVGLMNKLGIFKKG